MTDHDALCFALKRTDALKAKYTKARGDVALSALADRVCDGKRMPGRVRLLARTLKQMRKEKKQ